MQLAGCASAPSPRSARQPGSARRPAPRPTPRPPADPARAAVRQADWLNTTATGQAPAPSPACPRPDRCRIAWSTPAGRRRLRPAAGHRQHRDRRHRVRPGLRAEPDHRPVLWRDQVGTPVPLCEQPCGDISPLGITSTPVYDPTTRLVYVVAQTSRGRHVLAGARVSDGTRRDAAGIPSPDHQPPTTSSAARWPWPTGRVYVAFGGHFGDCGPYSGSVVAVPATGDGPIRSYLVPDREAGRHLGRRRPGGRPLRHHLRRRRQRRRAPAPLRRQRLGHRAHPAAAADRRVRAHALARGQLRRPGPRLDARPRCCPTAGSSRSARTASATC